MTARPVGPDAAERAVLRAPGPAPASPADGAGPGRNAAHRIKLGKSGTP
jgi:hypothetical protein